MKRLLSREGSAEVYLASSAQGFTADSEAGSADGSLESRKHNSLLRRSLATLALAGVISLFGAAPAAFAATGSKYPIGTCVLKNAVSVEQEYGSLSGLKLSGNSSAVEKFEGDLERCLESPNPIFPAADEVIWGGLAFVVLFGFMAWKGFPAVGRAMRARSEKIAADLDAADKAKAEASEVLSAHQTQLAGAKSEADQIISDARAQAERVAAEITARASEDAAQTRAKAATDIESARAQAVSDLRGVVADIAVGAAEQVIKANLDADTQRALIDAYIDELTPSNA